MSIYSILLFCLMIFGICEGVVGFFGSDGVFGEFIESDCEKIKIRKGLVLEDMEMLFKKKILLESFIICKSFFI